MFFRASMFSAFGAAKRWLGTNADGSTRALTTADFYKVLQIGRRNAYIIFLCISHKSEDIMLSIMGRIQVPVAQLGDKYCQSMSFCLTGRSHYRRYCCSHRVSH